MLTLKHNTKLFLEKLLLSFDLRHLLNLPKRRCLPFLSKLLLYILKCQTFHAFRPSEKIGKLCRANDMQKRAYNLIYVAVMCPQSLYFTFRVNFSLSKRKSEAALAVQENQDITDTQLAILQSAMCCCCTQESAWRKSRNSLRNSPQETLPNSLLSCP